jgi:hypothetical protein
MLGPSERNYKGVIRRDQELLRNSRYDSEVKAYYVARFTQASDSSDK